MENVARVWVGNLGEAAALSLKGYPVVAVRENPRPNPSFANRQSQYGFDLVDGISEDIDLYLKGQLMVSARDYYGAVNSLKKQRYDFEQGVTPAVVEDENLNNLKY